jgi:serine/threonine-protein kinase
MDKLLGKVLGNRYEIVEKIGEGGMALVYKAQCRLLNRFVAVKILRPEYIEDDEFIQKFDKESKAAASLSHPAIVNVYDVGADGEIRYIVMEYINGVTLKKYIKDYPGFLSNREIISITKQIALALDHAHQNHIIHRDIKPHNIMISEEGIVKVTDFGIARAITTSTIINTTDMMGSVHYSSPEQARGGYVDERSDLYSLGILLYELATKRVPFDGDSPVAVAMKHLKEEVILPSAINEEISYGLESIIMKSIQKTPDKRYQSALQLIEDLEDVLINPDLEIFMDGGDEGSPTMIMPNLGDMEPLDEAFTERTMNASRRPPQSSPNKMRTAKELGPNAGFKPDKKKLGMTIGLALLSVLLVFGIGMGVKRMLAPSASVEMPSVVGLDYKEAVEKVEGLGLKVDISQRAESKEYEVDQVISQSQEEGAKLKEGFTVVLVISTGTEKVAVPNLVQKQLKEAQYMIENLGLVVGTTEYVQNELPEGTVISQSPFSGVDIGIGGTVDLFVSKGKDPEKIIMPKLVGTTLESAQKKLAEFKITVNKTSYNYSDEYAKNIVMIQSIDGGSEVTEGATVNLVISKGKNATTTTPSTTNTGGTTGGTTGTTETPGSNTGTNTGTTTTVKYYSGRVNLISESDEVRVRVVMIQNGSQTEVYNKVHQKSEETISYTIQGEGIADLMIYVNDNMIERKDDIEFK